MGPILGILGGKQAFFVFSFGHLLYPPATAWGGGRGPTFWVTGVYFIVIWPDLHRDSERN